MNDKEMKGRIGVVTDTVKLTRAMQLLAASKIRRARQKRADSLRYLSELERVVSLLLYSRPERQRHPYLHHADAGKPMLIVVAGDKGLCGDYNHAILALAEEFIRTHAIDTIFAVGYEALEHFQRRGVELNRGYVHFQEPHAFDTEVLARDLLQYYHDDRYNRVHIAYTRTPSLGAQTPCVKQLLPMVIPPDPQPPYEVAFEPDSEQSLTDLLTQLLKANLYAALADSDLAIHCKRMVAMQGASRSGEEMLEALTAAYHTGRQEAITSELGDMNAFIFRKDKR
ncbi:MAG: FoF1 ATP synthase subunit gamma [Eubacteriales bacterium]